MNNTCVKTITLLLLVLSLGSCASHRVNDKETLFGEWISDKELTLKMLAPSDRNKLLKWFIQELGTYSYQFSSKYTSLGLAGDTEQDRVWVKWKARETKDGVLVEYKKKSL